MPAAWVGAAVAVYGAIQGGGSSGSGGTGSGGGAYDPYAQYRPQAAQQLQQLQANPGDASNTSYGKAMSQAAGRAMASQGYTGSGNALVAAANAGGQAYQQEFNNLSMLAGAGQSPAQAQGVANQQAQYNQQQQNQMWGQVGQLAKGIYNNYNTPSTVSDPGSSSSSMSNMDYFNNNGGSAAFTFTGP